MNIRALIATLIGAAGGGVIAFDPSNPASVRVATVIGTLILLAVHTLAAHWHLISETQATAQVATARSNVAAANAQAAATASAAGLADAMRGLTGPGGLVVPPPPPAGDQGPAAVPSPPPAAA